MERGKRERGKKKVYDSARFLSLLATWMDGEVKKHDDRGGEKGSRMCMINLHRYTITYTFCFHLLA